MIIIAAILIGAVVGDWRARKVGGNTRDRLHYAAVHAVGFAVVGILATAVLDRMLQR